MKQLLTIILCLYSLSTFAQKQAPSPTMHCDNLEVINKTKAMVNKKQAEGFEIIQGGFFDMDNGSLLPILVELDSKRVYHFIVVAPPGVKRMEVGIGHEALGRDEVREKILGWRDNLYYTEFTYVPPFQGVFLFSIIEKCKGKENFCSGIYIMAKSNKINVPGFKN